MTHRDGISDLSARNPARSDAPSVNPGHRKGRVTLFESPGAESLEMPPFRSLLGGVASCMLGGRQQALPMHAHRLRLASYPTPPRSDPYGSIFPSFVIRPRPALGQQFADEAGGPVGIEGAELLEADAAGLVDDGHLRRAATSEDPQSRLLPRRIGNLCVDPAAYSLQRTVFFHSQLSKRANCAPRFLIRM